jgi:glutamyl-tRNA synthetase
MVTITLHVLLYRAFGWEAPEFAFTIDYETCWYGKLSKRDGDKMGFVFPLIGKPKKRFIRLQRKGFSGSCNQLLALLVGMTERTKNYSQELVAFDLNRVHKSELNLIRKKINGSITNI